MSICDFNLLIFIFTFAGQKYAMLEMKSVISGIFRNFTLDPVTQFEELNWSIDLVLRVDSPMNVIFNLRE